LLVGFFGCFFDEGEKAPKKATIYYICIVDFLRKHYNYNLTSFVLLVEEGGGEGRGGERKEIPPYYMEGGGLSPGPGTQV
jgi:hypothetical protein